MSDNSVNDNMISPENNPGRSRRGKGRKPVSARPAADNAGGGLKSDDNHRPGKATAVILFSAALAAVIMGILATRRGGNGADTFDEGNISVEEGGAAPDASGNFSDISSEKSVQSNGGANGGEAVEAGARADTGGAETGASETPDGVYGRYHELLNDPDEMKARNCLAVDDGGDGVITIRFAGDLLLDGSYAVAASLRQRSSDGGIHAEDAFDDTMLSLMRDADVFMLNNEFTFTDRGTPVKGKRFTFRADPAYAAFLNEIGTDIVSLANNHSYDYGEISLLDTLDTLDAAGIAHVGAGRNISGASAPLYLITENVSIAIIGSTQIERMPDPDTRGAAESSPGVFRSMDTAALEEAIELADGESDFVIVFTHWGTEGQEEIDWSQTEQAPVIAAAGADLIIGSHPHVLQRIGIEGDVPVFYSLGNYLFNSHTLDTCLIEANFSSDDGNLMSVRFIPAIQSGCRTYYAEGEDRAAALERMRAISPDVSIDEDGLVTFGNIN